MSTATVTDELQSDDGYELTMEYIDASSPTAKMVGEELDAFLSRVCEKLNEINNESVSVDELSNTIIKLVAARLGNPTARTITTEKRSSNSWNLFQKANYDTVKSEMGDIGFFPIVPTDTSIGKPLPRDVMKELKKGYHGRPTDDETDGSPMASSSPGMPSPARPRNPSRMGNALIPVRSEVWRAERRKRWTALRKTVNR